MNNGFANSWTPRGIALIVLWLGIGLLYQDSIGSMVAIWNRSETFAHGWLIPVLSLWLVWRQKHQLAVLQPQSSYLGIAAIALTSLLWGVANLVGVLVVEQYALVMMIIATPIAVLGLTVAKRIAFPLAYLLFAVPAGEALVPALIDFTAWFTVQGLELTGIPVYWEGQLIAIPSGNFEVVEACSGVRYLIAALALGALYSHLSYHHWWKHLAFMLLCIVVPIIANGMRAYGIVMIAHLSDMKLATGIDHLIYGWLFFGLVMFLLFWLGSLWQDPPELVAGDTTPSPSSSTSAPPLTSALKPTLIISILAAIAASPGWLFSQSSSTTVVAKSTSPLQLTVPNWTASTQELKTWQPEFIGAQQTVRIDYQKGNKTIQVYIASYQQQRQGSELISSSNRLFRESHWLPQNRNTYQPSVSNLPKVKQIQLRNNQHPALLWSWYTVAGIRTNNPSIAKLAEIWGRLIGIQQATVIALKVDYDIDEASARETLIEFTPQLIKALEHASPVERAIP